jgi:site-specific recombinase XerD
MPNVQVSIYHDTRRAKGKAAAQDKEQPKQTGSEIYPVKLRVYYRGDRRLYSTGEELSIIDFERSYGSQKPQKEYKDIKFKLVELEKKANDIIEHMKTFSFHAFEKKMFRNTGDNDNVIQYYNEYVKQLKSEGRISTANNYENSLKSILDFAKRNKNNEITYLPFELVTSAFLKDYEQWMIGKNKKATTVGIYLRPLRSIFNIAKSEGVVIDDIYPFGKRRYQIPAGRNIKKTLTRDELKKLYQYKVKDGSEQEKARDFWFFSYQCNGMNLRDIAELKVSDLQGSNILFTRTKTKNTTKSDSKKIVVPITQNIKAFIEKYGTGQEKKDFLFPIFQPSMSAEEKLRVIQNFTRFVNQHIKIIAKAIGIDTGISTYWARHTYTSVAIKGGASMAYIQESLGHKDMKTTLNYFSGFEDNVKRDVAEKLMDF